MSVCKRIKEVLGDSVSVVSDRMSDSLLSGNRGIWLTANMERITAQALDVSMASHMKSQKLWR